MASDVEIGRWYAVYSKPYKERVAHFHLQRKGVEVFFPKLLLPRPPRPGRSPVVPLFPNYFFARISVPEEYNYLRWSPGVRCLVNFNGTPAPIDDEIIAFLRQTADREGVISARSTLAVGQEVYIVKGHFAGLVGVIQNPPDARGRVKVLMQLLNRQVRVEVPVHCIESGWTISDEKKDRRVA